MSINLKAPELRELKPRIIVCGVGGAGGNAVNNMIVSGLSGRRFRRRQHRRPGADLLARRADHPDGPAGDRGAGRRLEARGRARRGRGGDRGNSRSSGRRAHGVRHRRHGRRHGHRRRAGHRPRGPRDGHSHRRRRHQAVPFRGRAAHAPGRRRHHRTAEVRRHADRHPQPEPVPGRQRKDHLRRRLRDGRPGALFRRRLHHRPDGQGRPDQSRLRRRPFDHERNGQGDDGDRRGDRRAARRAWPPKRRSPIRCSTRPR